MTNLHIALVTYNCARSPLNSEVFAKHLLEFLGRNPAPALLAISLQEVSPIAYAFLGGWFLSNYLERPRRAVRILSKELCSRQQLDEGYAELSATHVGMTALLVFARHDLAPQVVRMEHAGVGVGLWGMGNKGAVALRFDVTLQGRDDPEAPLRTTLIAAHLAPAETAFARRNQDWSDIVRSLVFQEEAQKSSLPPEETGLLSGSDGLSGTSTPLGLYAPRSCVFLAGDLNYRTSDVPPYPGEVSSFPNPAPNFASEFYAQLLEKDQLLREMAGQRTFQGFHEAVVRFPPTYKHSDACRALEQRLEHGGAPERSPNGNGEQNASSNPFAEHRFPSWCDRILHLNTASPSQELGQRIEVQKYTALPLMSTSDHRPVAALMSVSPQESLDDSTTCWTGGAPFDIDPQWDHKRRATKRKELVVGSIAFLGLTWEGRALTVAFILGLLALANISPR